MAKIGRLLERGFFGGIVIAVAFAGIAVFLYLVYWLIKSLQPQKVRLKERRILPTAFIRFPDMAGLLISYSAWKNPLLFYGQDFSDWERILRELWSVTNRSEGDWIGGWLDSVGELLPGRILTTALSSSGDIREIQDLYTRSGAKMILVSTLMENVYTMVCEWLPDTVPITRTRSIS